MACKGTDSEDVVFLQRHNDLYDGQSMLRVSNVLCIAQIVQTVCKLVMHLQETGSTGLDMRGMRNLVKALPQYRSPLHPTQHFTSA